RCGSWASWPSTRSGGGSGSGARRSRSAASRTGSAPRWPSSTTSPPTPTSRACSTSSAGWTGSVSRPSSSCTATRTAKPPSPVRSPRRATATCGARRAGRRWRCKFLPHPHFQVGLGGEPVNAAIDFPELVRRVELEIRPNGGAGYVRSDAAHDRPVGLLDGRLAAEADSVVRLDPVAELLAGLGLREEAGEAPLELFRPIPRGVHVGHADVAVRLREALEVGPRRRVGAERRLD